MCLFLLTYIEMLNLRTVTQLFHNQVDCGLVLMFCIKSDGLTAGYWFESRGVWLVWSIVVVLVPQYDIRKLILNKKNHINGILHVKH